MDAYITNITCEEFYSEDWEALMAEIAEEADEVADQMWPGVRMHRAC